MRKPIVRLNFVETMMPEFVDGPPLGDEWIHEVKFDGYRSQIIKDADGIRIFTRRGHDWTAKRRRGHRHQPSWFVRLPRAALCYHQPPARPLFRCLRPAPPQRPRSARLGC